MSADGAGTPRERLLAAVLEQVRGGGLADVSLRGLATAAGTSHRMLLYHFGSREGLVAAVVAAVEAAQREVLAEVSADWAGDPAGVLRAFWADLADPARHASEMLFFEAVAMTMRDRPGTEHLRETLVEPWLAAAEAAAGAPAAGDGEAAGAEGDAAAARRRADARLGTAVTRGLLLDLLVTGDRAGVDAAMERFVDGFAGAAGPVGPAGPMGPACPLGPTDQPMPNTTVTVTPTLCEPAETGTDAALPAARSVAPGAA